MSQYFSLSESRCKMLTREVSFPTHPYLHSIPRSRDLLDLDMDRFESQTSADYEVHSQAESLQIAPNGFDVQAGIEIQNFWSDCQRYASLVAALEAERRAHAETRLVLESESQRLKALEAEVYSQTNMTANWAAAYQQCYVSLQQHMNEKKTLEMKICDFSGRIQRLENRVSSAVKVPLRS